MKDPIPTEKSRHIAFITFIALVVSSLLVIHPTETTLDSLFSLSLTDAGIKLLLAIALLIIIFVGRPRLEPLRRTLGALAATTLIYATLAAYSSQLAMGDMAILFFGALIATVESLEVQITATEVDAFTVLKGSNTKI